MPLRGWRGPRPRQVAWRPTPAVAGGPITPPTAVNAYALVEGSATRSFNGGTGLPTVANDRVVVQVQVENDAATSSVMTPSSAPSLTWNTRVDTTVGTGIRSRIYIFEALDSTGVSPVVTITPGAGGALYAARATVVRGSSGVGLAVGGKTAQQISGTRSGDDSMLVMGVNDWSTGAVGTPAWVPGGATTQSQQGTGATYLFGRWDDSGAAGTGNHGVSSPSYTTPTVAVLELLGTASVVTPPPVLPLVSSDPTGTVLAWRRVPVPTVLRSVAALGVSGDVTGTVTASAAVTAVASRTTWGSSAVTWGGTAVQWGTAVPSRAPLLASDAEGTWAAWQRAGSQFVRPVATPTAAGDVTGAVTASATVAASAVNPPIEPWVWSDATAAYRAAIATGTVSVRGRVTPASTGDVTGAATASATVTASAVDPVVEPWVWSDATAAYRQQVRTEPTAVVVGAIPITAPADVTGTVTASATVTATAVSPPVRATVWSDATTAYRAAIWTPPTTVVATRVPAVPGVGNVTGAATASATVSATAVHPPVRTVIWSDATSAYRNAVRTEPSAFVFAPVEPPAPGAGDVTGAVTASATVTASAVNPPVQRSYVASDAGGAWQSQVQFRPATVIRSAPAAPPGTGDVTGMVTASATVVASASNRAPLPVISSDPAGAHRAFLSSSTIYVRGRATPPVAGDVTGAVTASATVAALVSSPAPAPLVVSDPGGARQAYLSTRTIYVRGRVAPAAAGAVSGAVTASALVTAQVNSPGAVVGVVTASALVIATESGGTFQPVGVLTASTSPTSTLTAASAELGVLTATTQRTGGPT